MRLAAELNSVGTLQSNASQIAHAANNMHHHAKVAVCVVAVALLRVFVANEQGVGRWRKINKNKKQNKKKQKRKKKFNAIRCYYISIEINTTTRWECGEVVR